METSIRSGDDEAVVSERVGPFEYVPTRFRAPAWLRSAHAQTLGGKLFRPTPPVPLQRERWETPDGDFLDLDFVDPPAPDKEPERRLAIVLHGLEGSATRSYALLSYAALRRVGVRAVGLNFRGCSGEPNRLARFYHSGDTADLRWVVDRLRSRYPRAAVGAIGFSLGGNVLLKLLGELGDAGPSTIGAAVAISVPFDLAAGSAQLERGPMARLYTYYFIRMLRAKVRAKQALLNGACDIDRVLTARTLREFDHNATAPLHGFRDADDYYARASSHDHIARIRVPTLIIHSLDDPFLPSDRIPRDAAAANPWVTTAITDHGGHVGFITGPPWAPRFWAEDEAARFLSAQL
ncbi:MAG: hydrolase [Longimicrobiales bacterium]